ncbi:hypothetical protein JTB14_007937 [Gonioctena quinquepunctata]|nr:hypothetical protein JTB14_007937 [Gonioctena quinquepunctata]
MMYPGSHMTVDEQLLGFSGRAPLRVYMKSKPDKYHTLVSYSADNNRAVILLSTEHNADEISDEAHSYKPEIVLHYNMTEGGVDTADKMVKEYTT